MSILAIPLSLILALAALKLFGLTFNAMTVVGLAVALGVVVDDAVIDVETILTRVDDAAQTHGSRGAAILAASLQVRAPVVYATLTMIVAVAPLLFLHGALGAVLVPFAGAIIAACAASLVVAMVATPALAYLVLAKSAPAGERIPDDWAGSYQAILVRLQASPRSVYVAALAIAAVATLALALIRPTLLPPVHDDQLEIQLAAPASSSLEVMRDLGVRITGELDRIAGVTHVATRIGRDQTDDASAGLESATFDVSLAPGLGGGAQDAVAARIRGALSSYPGLNPVVRTHFNAALDRNADRAPFSVAIYGADLDALDAVGAKVARALRTLPNGQTAHLGQSAHAPIVRVDIDFQRLAIYGLSAADVLDTVQAAFAGQSVAKIYQGDRTIDLAVIAQDSLRRDPEAVGDLLLRSPSGFSVPLKSVANVYLTDGRVRITHDNGLRRQIVEADPPPAQSTQFAAAARKLIARTVALPAGVFVEIDDGGGGAAQANRDLAIDYLLSAFAIFALLAVAFDARSAALILASTLFAFVGGAIAVLAMGGAPSIGAMAGLIALFGLSQRGAILLITRLEDLVVAGRAPWSFETVAKASRDRLDPLLISTALIVVVLAPFAVQAGAAGNEFIGPMAIVIIAGLITSALASALLSPILLYALWRPGLARLSRGHWRSASDPPTAT
jgi:Cu/Ag efflux pump CusA